MNTYVREALERARLLGCEYGARVTVYGFRGLRIEGHKGLAAYADDGVTVRLPGKKLTIRGEKLRVLEITRDELYIGGRICGMDTEDEKRR